MLDNAYAYYFTISSKDVLHYMLTYSIATSYWSTTKVNTEGADSCWLETET